MSRTINKDGILLILEMVLASILFLPIAIIAIIETLFDYIFPKKVKDGE